MHDTQPEASALLDALRGWKPPSQPAFPDYSQLRQTLAQLQRKQEEGDIAIPGCVTPAVEQAREHWAVALREQNFARVKDSDIKYLCTVTDVVTDELFLQVLEHRSQRVRDRVTIPLMLSCHQLWKENSAYRPVASWLALHLPRYTGTAKCVEKWQRSVYLLLGEDGPRQLATGIVDERLPISHLQDKYALILESSGFLKDVTRQAVRAVCSQLVQPDSPPDESIWTYFLGELLPRLADDKQELCSYLAQLILTVNTYRIDETRSLAQKKLTEYILGNNSLRDPRIYPAKWIGSDEGARRTFMNWLSTEEIELFFEVIIRTGRKDRKKFWMSYLPKIQDSVVAVGSKDLSHHRGRLDNLRRSGRSFSQLAGDSINSAFVLDFGQYVAVEFSESGRAYVYDKQTFIQRQQLGIPVANPSTIRRLRYQVQDLKDSQTLFYAKFAVSHHSNYAWMSELRNFLASLGIRGD